MDNRESRTFNGSTSSFSSAGHGSRFGDDAASCNRFGVMRVVRLLLESLETAFFLANIYLESYGLAKIFDMINQIIPTAYVYNTGYWVFYNNQYRQPICVCNRFGIRCPHVRSDLHFVNLNPLSETVQSYFLTPYTGKLYPVLATIKVTPVLSDVLRAYDVNISVTVRPLSYENNKFTITGDDKAIFNVETRYILTPEHCPLESSVAQFEPSPVAHLAYSSYFQTMERFRAFPTAAVCETQVPRNYTIVSADLPRFGMVINNVTYGVPSHHFANTSNAVFLDGFSNIWTFPDDNSCNMSFRGECVSNTTFSSVMFCKQRRNRFCGQNGKNQNMGPKGTENKPPLHVRVDLNNFCNPRPDYTAPCPPSKVYKQERNSPETEQNFLGSDYENAFPLLPQPCSFRKKWLEKREAFQAAQPTATTTDTSFEGLTYARQAASVQDQREEETRGAAVTNDSSDNKFVRPGPEVTRAIGRRLREILEMKRETAAGVKVNDCYIDFPPPPASPDLLQRPFDGETPLNEEKLTYFFQNSTLKD